ncbi:MAG: 16S rRNA (cytidine(1402)-2'-O)-methyltransferase [Defluviitaleaceae bacterium]|nr:16S rRNA (cytidine(1402)-2'-O)-methyltransferase [Defluviitaleaceae bacterium]
MDKGTLYICATPIGNLEDITLRVLRVLQEVGLIACEDTRHTAKLLHHFEIRTPTTSYHENNKEAKGHQLLSRLNDGENIALVSDSGMPGISDPGRELIQACHKEEIPVTICPGATAGLSALVLSGFTAHPHVFEGFLPRDKSDRKKILANLATERRTMVFYEAPHRLLTVLSEMQNIWGDRNAALVRELTKKFENVSRGTLSQLLNNYVDTTPRGEFVIIVEGATEQISTYPENVQEHVESYVNQGHSEMDAIKLVAKERGVAKNVIYKQIKQKVIDEFAGEGYN